MILGRSNVWKLISLINNYNKLEKIGDYKVELEKLRKHEDRELFCKRCKDRKEVMRTLYEEIINKNIELNERKER